MQKRIHLISVTVYDREKAFHSVSELLHKCAPFIHLRVGYPMPDKNCAVIFLVAEMTTDELGALTGRLGQIPSVSAKSTTLKV